MPSLESDRYLILVPLCHGMSVIFFSFFAHTRIAQKYYNYIRVFAVVRNCGMSKLSFVCVVSSQLCYS